MKFIKWITSSNPILFAIIICLTVTLVTECLSPYCPSPNANYAPEAASQEKSSDGLFHKSPDWWTAAFTGTLTISTILLWLATSNLVSGGEDSSERQLRAYISVTPKIVYNWPNTSDGVAVGIIVKNHGKTPAFEISFDGFVVIGNRKIPDNFAWPEPVSLFNQNNAIFPDEELPFRFHTRIIITHEDFAAVEVDKKRIYTKGIVTYRDAFNIFRTTKFSFSFGGIDFAKCMNGDPEARWDWEYGHSHNDGT
jgi:hypothetical protein